MSYKTILLEKEENVSTITLNRPDRLNAHTDEMGLEIAEALRVADTDKETRVLVITGAGRAFCAGADVKAFAEAAEARKRGEDRPSVSPSIIGRGPWLFRNFSKPIIASINGPAMGIGLTMALACDLRIAADMATLGAIFVRMGVMPEFGSTYNLPRLVGIAKACELVFTGKIIEAKEAFEIGLVNQVVPADQLKAATRELAASIAQWPPLAIQTSKRALYQGLDADLSAQLTLETMGLTSLFNTEDHAEAAKAFVEKRKPVFKGR